jgi:hypothetical protein
MLKQSLLDLLSLAIKMKVSLIVMWICCLGTRLSQLPFAEKASKLASRGNADHWELLSSTNKADTSWCLVDAVLL